MSIAVIEPLHITPLQYALGIAFGAAITAFATWRIIRWAGRAIRRLRLK